MGALLSVDAVHIAPHKAINMDAIGADMLFCSAYKFFGGHIGIAAVQKSVFEALDTPGEYYITPDCDKLYWGKLD